MFIVNIGKIPIKKVLKLLKNCVNRCNFNRNMLKFHNPRNSEDFTEPNESTNFVDAWKSMWDKLHDETDVFRYKMGHLEEKYLDGRYLIQLNPDRRTKRRPPDEIMDICQPFDEQKVNFTKVSSSETLFNIKRQNDPTTHKLIVNVSPITRYHSLLCPSVAEKLPQVVTEDSLRLVLEIMFVAQNRNLRIGFNSLCAMASVNHLHYHLFLERNDLPVEKVKCTKIRGRLHAINESYPAAAFCFEIVSANSIKESCKDIYTLIEHLLKNNVAHNIFITREHSLISEEQSSEVIRVIIYPRKSSAGFQKMTAFYVALCELSGWFPVYTREDFDNLTPEDLEKELRKWQLDDFDGLCKQVEPLY